MFLERRDFIRTALTCTAGMAVAGTLPTGCFSPPLLADAAPVIYTSLLNFGGKVLEGTAQSLLEDWLKTRVVVPSPRPKTFADRYNPTHQIVVRGSSFLKQTKVPDRTLLIDTCANLVHSGETSPTDSSNLNVPEMDELADQKNTLLWTECGCKIVRLPISAKPRLDPADANDGDGPPVRYAFTKWKNGHPYQLADLPSGANLHLDYFRWFHTGDDQARLVGFGFHRTDQPSSKAMVAGRFAVVNWG